MYKNLAGIAAAAALIALAVPTASTAAERKDPGIRQATDQEFSSQRRRVRRVYHSRRVFAPRRVHARSYVHRRAFFPRRAFPRRAYYSSYSWGAPSYYNYGYSPYYAYAAAPYPYYGYPYYRRPFFGPFVSVGFGPFGFGFW
jgi:hypothetical protein